MSLQMIVQSKKNIFLMIFPVSGTIANYLTDLKLKVGHKKLKNPI